MKPTTGVSMILFATCVLMLWGGQMETFAGNLVTGVLLYVSGIAFGIAAAVLRKA
jgi:hypothetical protein